MEKYYPVPAVAPKTFVLKLMNNWKCQGCESRKQMKIEKLLREIPGVHSASINPNTWLATISGTVDPQVVIWVLQSKNILKPDLSEEIPRTKTKHKMQMKTLPVPVDQEFHNQDFVAKMLQIADSGGLKELKITTLNATFNGKDKDGISLKSDTLKKTVADDDHGCNPKSQGDVHNSYYSHHHDLGPKSQSHAHNSYYSNYGNYRQSPAGPAPSGGPHLKPETPWQGNYFRPPEPVASYEPSAPPWSHGYPFFIVTKVQATATYCDTP